MCATERNAGTAGGVYPFPLFEDGDFDIPSVYMKDTEGEKLLACAGKTVELVSRARRIPETAFNVVGRNSSVEKNRIVVTAHIDTKIDTTGAIDNGTGVTILLLVAELLQDSSCNLPIELLVLNGEDYYGAPGQVKYVEQNAGRFSDILLNINIDGAGYKEGLSCFSPFNLPDELQAALHELFAENPALVEGLPWYQGDHSMFLQQGCPAIAVSSQWFIEHMETQEITHTPKDNLEVVPIIGVRRARALWSSSVSVSLGRSACAVLSRVMALVVFRLRVASLVIAQPLPTSFLISLALVLPSMSLIKL